MVLAITRACKPRPFGEFARIGKALANSHRLHRIELLARGERAVEVAESNRRSHVPYPVASAVAGRSTARRRSTPDPGADRPPGCVSDAGQSPVFALPGRGQAPGRRAARRRSGTVLDPRLLRWWRHPAAVFP